MGIGSNGSTGRGIIIWMQKMNFNLAVWLFFARCTLSAASTSKYVFDRIKKFIKKIHRIQLIEKKLL